MLQLLFYIDQKRQLDKKERRDGVGVGGGWWKSMKISVILARKLNFQHPRLNCTFSRSLYSPLMWSICHVNSDIVPMNVFGIPVKTTPVSF